MKKGIILIFTILLIMTFNINGQGKSDSLNSNKDFIEKIITDSQSKLGYTIYLNKSKDSKILVCDMLKSKRKQIYDSLSKKLKKFLCYNNDTFFINPLRIDKYVSFDKKEIFTEGSTDGTGFNHSYINYIFVNKELYVIRQVGFCIECVPHYEIKYYIFRDNKIIKTIFARANREDVITNKDIVNDGRLYKTAMEIYENYKKLPVINCDKQ